MLCHEHCVVHVRIVNREIRKAVCVSQAPFFLYALMGNVAVYARLARKEKEVWRDEGGMKFTTYEHDSFLLS